MNTRIDMLLKRNELALVSPRSNGGPWILTSKANEYKSYHALAGDDVIARFDTKKLIENFLEGYDASVTAKHLAFATGAVNSEMDSAQYQSEIQRFFVIAKNVFEYTESHCSNIAIGRALTNQGFENPEAWEDTLCLTPHDFFTRNFGRCVEWSFHWQIFKQPLTKLTQEKYTALLAPQTMDVIIASAHCNSQQLLMKIEPIQYGRCSECDNVIMTEAHQRMLLGDDTPVTIIDGKYRCGRC